MLIICTSVSVIAQKAGRGGGGGGGGGASERQLQQNLNKIENLATRNALKLSKSKTQCVHFCQLRKQHDDPVLRFCGSPIPVVEEFKFLGMIFDRKLSFISHIKYLTAIAVGTRP